MATTKKEGFQMVMIKIDRASQLYKNEDSYVDIKMTEIKVNWKPKNFNRLLRFMRYMKYKGDVFEQ